MGKVLISPENSAGRRRDEKTGRICSELWKEGSDPVSKGGYKRIGAMVEKSFEGKECGYVLITSMVNAVKRNQTSWRNREKRSDVMS